MFNTSGYIVTHLHGVVDSGSFTNLIMVTHSMHNENLGFHLDSFHFNYGLQQCDNVHSTWIVSYNFLTCIRQVTFAICRILLQVTGIGFLTVFFLIIFHFDAVNLFVESDVLIDLDLLQLPLC